MQYRILFYLILLTMALNPEDERKLRRNWTLLKQELNVDDFVHRFVEDGVFSPNFRSELVSVLPNTPSMRAEKFLNSVIASGNRGYQAMCQFIRDNPDNRYSRVVEALGIQTNTVNNNARSNVVVNNNNSSNNNGTNNTNNNSNSGVRNVDVANQESRPSTAVSSTSSGTINSETGEKHRRIKNVPVSTALSVENRPEVTAPVATVAPVASSVQQSRPSVGGFSTRSISVGGAPISSAPIGGARRSSTGEDSENVTQQRALYVEPSFASTSDMSLHSYSSMSSESSALSALSLNNSITPQSGKNENTPRETPREQKSWDNAGSDTPVDMQVLEQELVRMAPTIADLFKKIAKQTSSVPTTEEELQRVKEENERLRKTNKSLIEKLNMFQQKIIQLQLDNKKLKENGDITRAKKDELTVKASELQEMQNRLDNHKKALEEKEQELNTQLLKLKEIEEENEQQREKINKLEELQDEGIIERNIQQEQISILVEEKERQKDQIDSLEEQQKQGEQRLFRLEQRLNQLEQGPRRQGRNRRVMSPPRNPNHWMNGYVDRSHHANVKYQSFNLDRDGKRSSSQGKAGWPFI